MKHRLDFQRRHPLAVHFEHLVAAALKPEISLRILAIAVPRIDPLTLKRGLGFGVLVPVVCKGAIALDHELADGPWRDGLSQLIDEAHVISRDKDAAAPGLATPWTVRDEGLQQLSGADPVKNLQAKARLPAMIELGRQRLAGGDAQTHGGKIVVCCHILYAEEPRVQGGNG